MRAQGSAVTTSRSIAHEKSFRSQERTLFAVIGLPRSTMASRTLWISARVMSLR
ncbi:MAG: hypothetical protein USCAAHI_03044 [Beijerinckiaceae bacterium]|nr:MAG: hypothetical protein USCAAHI_03044 [Beijerinckiaceae bacterium]